MKYAVPPTADTAMMPTTITAAMRIEIHVFLLLMNLQQACHLPGTLCVYEHRDEAGHAHVRRDLQPPAAFPQPQATSLQRPVSRTPSPSDQTPVPQQPAASYQPPSYQTSAT